MSKRLRDEQEETSWCTIESDPGIFTLLIEKLGVKGVQVEEIYDLDSNQLSFDVFGFIFLFKWSKVPEDNKENVDQFSMDPTIFFARQEISNACATQAILHILLNLEEGNVEIGQVLDNFKSFAHELPPDMRGLCLSNSLEIRQIHNEFGNLEELLAFGDDNSSERDTGSKDPFHFVAFIQKNGKIYELDGLKEAPIIVSEGAKKDWKEAVLEIIKGRVGNDSEIRFNLMAITADRRKDLVAEIAELNEKINDPSLESDASRSSWLSKRFKAQQELEDEDAKWSRYRKQWSDRQESHKEMQPKTKTPSNTAGISPQVQDLLNSLTAKGLKLNK